MPSFSFIATANCAVYVGATPVFADVEAADGNLSVRTVEPVLTEPLVAVLPQQHALAQHDAIDVKDLEHEPFVAYPSHFRSVLHEAVERACGFKPDVALEVSDTHSNIQRVEYSRDGLSWSAAFPVDGIADSRTERFEISVEGIDARGLSVRAIDMMNNTTPAYAAPQ